MIYWISLCIFFSPVSQCTSCLCVSLAARQFTHTNKKHAHAREDAFINANMDPPMQASLQITEMCSSLGQKKRTCEKTHHTNKYHM